MARKSVVLFDIDGTLIRGAGPQHKNALIEGVRLVTGCSTTLDGIATAGMLDCDLITGMLQAQGISEPIIRDGMKEIVFACERSYAENCRADLTPFVCRNVRETLDQLQSEGAVVGLVTGNLTAIGWRKIELAGLRSYFEVGAFGEEAETRAQLGRIAASRLFEANSLPPEIPVSLIGDHANDIQAAKENGFRAIAVATGVMPYEELAARSPDILVNHLGELDLRALF